MTGVDCASSTTDYTVHEGEIIIGARTWYNHTQVLCDRGGAMTSASVAAVSGQRYFLVVPITLTPDGSYGLGSFDAERPASLTGCRGRRPFGCP